MMKLSGGQPGLCLPAVAEAATPWPLELTVSVSKVDLDPQRIAKEVSSFMHNMNSAAYLLAFGLCLDLTSLIVFYDS